jgi:polar amino acid transport system permease protein
MNFLDIFGVLARGLLETISITVACSLTGFVSGLLFTVLRRMDVRPLTLVINTVIYVLRGVPLLVLLFLVYFGFPGLGLRVSPMLAMMLSLGLISGAYLAEVFRGALASVDPSEVLAARASGMTSFQTMLHIEFPQMLRISFQGMVSEFTSVLKYSPFAYTVGIPEITKEAMSLAATTLRGIEIYFVVGCLYYMIYRVFLLIFKACERHFRIPGMGP